MSERLAGTLEKSLLSVSHPQCVRANHTHAVGMHVPQALTETLQASERACGDLLVDAPVLFDARRKANHLAQPIDNNELAVRVTRDDHVKAVRPEIDSCEDVRNGAGRVGGVWWLGRSGRDSWTHSLCRRGAAPARP
jgi:hypothetical protein